jgi:hypothetical protein
MIKNSCIYFWTCDAFLSLKISEGIVYRSESHNPYEVLTELLYASTRVMLASTTVRIDDDNGR